jgi:hypothetical protein
LAPTASRLECLSRLISASSQSRSVKESFFTAYLFCNWGFWSLLCRFRKPIYKSVNLEPVFGSIDTYRFMKLPVPSNKSQTQGALCWCASMGGLAVRAWLADQPADKPEHW